MFENQKVCESITYTAEGPCLAQVAGAGKGHEVAALPDVLALLDLSSGTLVSLDALGCQLQVAAQIGAQGGDYLLALKQNQRNLRAEAEWPPATRPGAGRQATYRCASK